MSTLRAKHVVIAGGSGFLGTSLAHHLDKQGAQVTILARSSPPSSAPCNFVRWDGASLGSWVKCLNQSDAVVNLAGRTVDCIKTPDHRDEILRSRVDATRAIGAACAQIAVPPAIWIQMSTAHIYGDPPEARCTEESALGLGLAPDVARAWEAAFEQSRLPTQRGVVLRTSFVVGQDRGAGGGALARLKFLTSIGLGGRVGRGTQGFSWIHEHDLNRIFQRAISDPTLDGPYLATSPEPVSQAEFMRALRQVMRVPIGLPCAPWMARIGAPLVFRTDPDLALYGRFVLPKRLGEAGFSFSFPSLIPALRDLAA